MLSNRDQKIGKIDWWLVACYLILVTVGWINIYSALYSEEHPSIFDISQRYGMQFIWILTSLGIAASILFFINSKIYGVFSPMIYIAVIFLLFLVIFLGKEINGSRSWFVLGPVRFQPAEVSKISTSLLLAYVMSKYGFRLSRMRHALTVASILLIPMLLIILEKETGSALVYTGFAFMLYREGLSGWLLAFGLLSIFLFVITLSFSPSVALIWSILLLGILDGLLSRKLFRQLAVLVPLAVLLAFLPRILEIEPIEKINPLRREYWTLLLALPAITATAVRGFRHKYTHTKYLLTGLICAVILIFSVNFIFENILQPHQRARIENLLGIQEDLQGAGYNVHQSKIAIGSGGWFGKGFLEGTQTKFNFVPEQGTDFIFCTIGEEWGFAGSVFILGIYIFMLIRILNLSEKQKDPFTRIYGYCIASCLFMHVFINIGMTMGLVPVIGIPLPFISYGGSSLWSFTILLFIFIRLDSERWKY